MKVGYARVSSTVKDVSFEEDACRTRTGQIPFVQTMVRNFAINFINLNYRE